MGIAYSFLKYPSFRWPINDVHNNEQDDDLKEKIYWESLDINEDDEGYFEDYPNTESTGQV